MKLNFIAPLPPSVNEYRKYRVIYSRGKPTVQTYKTKETYQYEKHIKNLLQDEMKKQGWVKPPKESYVYVWVTFFFARINQDDNNYYKVLCDSLEASGVIENDNRFIIRTKDVFVESKNPHIEVQVEVAPKIGRFKDKSELNSFVNKNCLFCKKYKKEDGIDSLKKCRTFRNMLENRIFPQEIENMGLNCLKIRK